MRFIIEIGWKVLDVNLSINQTEVSEKNRIISAVPSVVQIRRSNTPKCDENRNTLRNPQFRASNHFALTKRMNINCQIYQKKIFF